MRDESEGREAPLMGQRGQTPLLIFLFRFDLPAGATSVSENSYLCEISFSVFTPKASLRAERRGRGRPRPLWMLAICIKAGTTN